METIKHSLALNVIAGNEIKIIHRFLDYLPYEFFDEIVLCVNGTDGTFEACEKYQETHPKIKLFKTVWNNDFAEARNFCKEQTTSDFVLWLDIDDLWVKDCERQIKTDEFQKILSSPEPIAVLFTIQNIGVDHQIKEEFEQIRLYSNKKEITYSGIIHEHLGKSLVKCGATLNKCLSLTVQHTGYADKNLNQVKCQRNLDLLLQVVEKDAATYCHMAACYIGLYRNEKAIETYLELIKTFPVDYEFYQYVTYNIGLIYEKTGFYFSAMDYYIRSQNRSGLGRIGHLMEYLNERLVVYSMNGSISDSDMEVIQESGNKLSKIFYNAFMESKQPPNPYSSDIAFITSYVGRKSVS